jgi:hypothetical protein
MPSEQRNAADDLLSDLKEVSDGLVDWAKEQLAAGLSPADIIAKLKEAALLSGRP